MDDFTLTDDDDPAKAAPTDTKTIPPKRETPTDGAKKTPAAPERDFDRTVKEAAATAKEKYQEAVKIAQAAKDHTTDFTADDIAQNKVGALLAYFGPLFLIPLFTAKNSPFARFHLNQGIIFFILAAIAGAVWAVLWNVTLFGTLYGLVYVAGFLFFLLMGLNNVAQGRARDLPFIGQYRLLA